MELHCPKMNDEAPDHDSLDALLEGWREPMIREDFSQSVIKAADIVPVVAEVYEDSSEPNIGVGFFGNPLQQGLAAAACLALLLTAILSTLRTAVSDPNDLVEQALDSDDAVTELNRLIYWEELANADSLEAMDNADMAMLLFATGG